MTITDRLFLQRRAGEWSPHGAYALPPMSNDGDGLPTSGTGMHRSFDSELTITCQVVLGPVIASYGRK